MILSFFIFFSGLSHQGYSQLLSSRIDDLVNDYVAHQHFMGTVLVAEKGKVVFAKGYGLAAAAILGCGPVCGTQAYSGWSIVLSGGRLIDDNGGAHIEARKDIKREYPNFYNEEI